jgi:drug/metabolite transporter (DMT)-like permease
MNPLLIALAAVMCFATASTFFAHFSKSISPIFMNTFKAVAALIAFGATALILGQFNFPETRVTFALLASGFLGLMIGDFFMLKAMTELGAARMLMIFGLQPFLLGIGAYVFFNQNVSPLSVLGVMAMILCLFTLSLERFKSTGHWQVRGLIHGLVAILLDAIGVLLTRWSFDHGIVAGLPITSIQVNFIRCLGAVAGFGLYHVFVARIQIVRPFLRQTRWDRAKIILASLGGTYFSLMLYLTAISKGTLSTVSAVTITGPLFAALIECIVKKSWPSWYLLIAFTFFALGFGIFMTPQ